MATKQFRTGMIVLLAVFGIVSVIVAWALARSIRSAVEEATSTPTTVAASRPPAESLSILPPASPVGTAISARGAQLRSARGKVFGMDPENGCESLIKTPWMGECGVEDMVGSRTAWVVESVPDEGWANDGVARVRILTYSDELDGWVEQLVASDNDEPPWMNVRVVVHDLTGDGKPELVVGYHYAGSGQDLGTDIVVNDDGVPRVYHPDDAVRGSVVFQGGDLIQYRADPAPGEANCCPSAFERRTIAWDGQDFRVVVTEPVPPGQVPASAL